MILFKLKNFLYIKKTMGVNYGLHAAVEDLESKLDSKSILDKIPKYDKTDPRARDNALRIILRLRPPLPPEEKPPQFIHRQSRRQLQKTKGKQSYFLCIQQTLNNLHWPIKRINETFTHMTIMMLINNTIKLSTIVDTLTIIYLLAHCSIQYYNNNKFV